MDRIKSKSILIGLTASIGLLGFYFAVTGWASGLDFAVNQFIALWYWVIPLTIGFGAQAGLFAFIKFKQKECAASGMAASGATSGLAMVACCAHRLVDIVPFLGATVLAAYLARYQTYLLALGLAANGAGIIYLLRIKKHLNHHYGQH